MADSATTSPSPEIPKPEKPQNPALKALGLPRLRLPGKKMSIFLGTVLAISGLIYHDRKERRANRQKWKDRVAFISQQPLSPNALTRKVTVYLAPPAGDTLDITIEHFTQYVKPILTAAAIDFDIVSGTRQGEIRYHVAEKIRNERKGIDETEPAYKEATKNLIRDNNGGVILVGRGAYKEYLHGLNEGWLGPVDPPATEPEQELVSLPVSAAAENSTAQFLETADAAVANAENSTKAAEEGVVTATTPAAAENEPEEDSATTAESNEDKKPKIPKAFILQSDYANAQTPPELSKIELFEPIVYIPHPHILGFLHTGIRTYRYFNKKLLADRVGRITAGAVLGESRPFSSQDLQSGTEEEDEWPKKWKATALEKNSEWIQDLVVDERIAQRLKVYTVPEDSASSEVD
ncbi:mitochondrial import inner membrane translocase subunit Tim54 [Lipomyces japonicus]|uniref:mitochondrial import inner membrane translocase subunit Tim54 n=1 Tax=Lipomyces japonicus TaxID=56871 RepID=UPI0034CEC48D